MKSKLYSIIFAAALAFSSLQCTNPIKDIEVVVNADVIRYSAVLELRDLSGNPIPTGLNVTVSGADKDAVYDLGGLKELSIVDGTVSVGIDPHMEPTADNPVRFNITVSGPNYLPVTVPFTISADNFAQIRSANLVNTTTPPPGVAVATATATVSGGKITAPLTLSTLPEPGEPEVTSLTIPANTQFKDASGKVITSGTLSVTIAQFDFEQSASLASFPGGSYMAESFVNASGETGFGTFVPAGFSEISMSIGGVPVKTFSQPINLSVVLDPSYIVEETASAVKAGDVLNISSYDNNTAVWKMEKDGTVAAASSKLTLDFTTTHLSWFSWGRSRWYRYPPVPPYTYLGITAGNITHSTPVRVDVSYANVNCTFGSFTGVLNPEGTTFFYLGYLSSNASYKYTITDLASGQVIGTGTFIGGKVNNVAVTIPPPSNAVIKMTLTVKCPGKQVVVSPPDFYLYYRESNAVSKEFKLLGLVKNGKFNTTELKVATLYDFKAVWGSKTKIVNKKTVTLDNSMEVNEGNYGNYKGNLDMLIEECK